MKSIALIPIYKSRFSSEEERNVKHSLSNLYGQDCVVSWLAPENIDRSYYDGEYCDINWSFHNPTYFRSVRDYSRLLLSEDFYVRYLSYEFILIVQPDSVVLRPTLNYWLDQPYDYIGAPWPKGWEYPLPVRSGETVRSINCRAFVGNGGLSLRRTSKIHALLNSYDDARRAWSEVGNPEDLLISMTATLSPNILIPTIGAASMFSRELDKELLQFLTGIELPFGLHGEKNVTDFFDNFLR
jgi:hypothetical protein